MEFSVLLHTKELPLLIQHNFFKYVKCLKLQIYFDENLHTHEIGLFTKFLCYESLRYRSERTKDRKQRIDLEALWMHFYAWRVHYSYITAGVKYQSY